MLEFIFVFDNSFSNLLIFKSHCFSMCLLIGNTNYIWFWFWYPFELLIPSPTSFFPCTLTRFYSFTFNQIIDHHKANQKEIYVQNSYQYFSIFLTFHFFYQILKLSQSNQNYFFSNFQIIFLLRFLYHQVYKQFLPKKRISKSKLNFTKVQL